MTSAFGMIPAAGVRETFTALVAREGSMAHIHCRALTQGRPATRDLADAVHLLCVLHGRAPGVIDLASGRSGSDQAQDWLDEAVAGFAGERGFLTRLVVAAGPLPSTPGQAESEAAVLGQRHAIEMLAGSDRRGCALGAAAALVADWHAIREVLVAAAARFGVEPPPPELPRQRRTRAVAEAVGADAGLERAFGFGAHQLLVQHAGLWSLLESRQAARG